MDIPVAPGDYVNEDDVVIVLETDKVSVDVRASEGGKIVEILGEVDDVVGVGSALYRLDTDVVPPATAAGSGGTASADVTPPPPPPPAAATVAAALTPTPSIASAPPPPSPKKAAAAAPTSTSSSLPAMEVVTTSLGNRPERRSKMSRMR